MNRRILFIEDDPAIVQMYRIQLEANGFEVDAAGDGEKGLERATVPPPPRVVFLDMRLPKRDGLSVLAALRQSPTTAALPVVVLSNYSDRELVAQARGLGILDYLVKSDTMPSTLLKVAQQVA
ncbi:MAG: hypothetical protein NVS9B1_22000 [Candidatus Dormibacteraceae bacterium]